MHIVYDTSSFTGLYTFSLLVEQPGRTQDFILGAWYQMVTQIMLRTDAGKSYFSEKKVSSRTALDLIKCLKQIK